MTVESAAKLLSLVLIAASLVATLTIDPAFLWVLVAIGAVMVVRALTGFCVFASFFSLLGFRSRGAENRGQTPI